MSPAMTAAGHVSITQKKSRTSSNSRISELYTQLSLCYESWFTFVPWIACCPQSHTSLTIRGTASDWYLKNVRRNKEKHIYRSYTLTKYIKIHQYSEQNTSIELKQTSANSKKNVTLLALCLRSLHHLETQPMKIGQSCGQCGSCATVFSMVMWSTWTIGPMWVQKMAIVKHDHGKKWWSIEECYHAVSANGLGVSITDHRWYPQCTKAYWFSRSAAAGDPGFKKHASLLGGRQASSSMPGRYVILTPQIAK